MNAKTYSVRIEVDTDVISMAVQTMLEVRRELAFQVTPNPLATSELAHGRPASESGVSGDVIPLLTTLISLMGLIVALVTVARR